MRSVELFAGAGGLGMGLTLAGFENSRVVEWNQWACDTIRENSLRAHPLVADWPLIQADVRSVDFSDLADKIDLVAGGPPCQPFSLGGKHRGHADERDMFPAAVDVVRTVRPEAFVFENVRGLTRPAFENYFQYTLLQLSHPEIRRSEDENWVDHLGRLEREHTTGFRARLTYDVVHRVINAADYGTPQKRERVFIVGFRSDLSISWAFPDETHSLDALLVDQFVDGTYWDRHRVPTAVRPKPDKRIERRIEKLRRKNFDLTKQRPWRTVRDALSGLPTPRVGEASVGYKNHEAQPGARSYPGHTGSPMDLPAKALKAGDHGVPGGENMLVADDGSVRYFSVREAARIQTFPDSYAFHGSWSETMRQLGNAVPVRLAYIVASSVAASIIRSKENRLTKIIRHLAK